MKWIRVVERHPAGAFVLWFSSLFGLTAVLRLFDDGYDEWWAVGLLLGTASGVGAVLRVRRVARGEEPAGGAKLGRGLLLMGAAMLALAVVVLLVS